MCGDYPDSFALFLTTPQEVIKATNELANKTSAGYDNISVNLIKKIIHHIADTLFALINKSFEYGIVRDQLKIARVCPIFKSGDQSDFTNYRPISVLPAFSKIFEKLFHTRLCVFGGRKRGLCVFGGLCVSSKTLKTIVVLLQVYQHCTNSVPIVKNSQKQSKLDAGM